MTDLVQQMELLPGGWDQLELPHDPDGNHGEVFTRAWVVDLILDLAGYMPDRDLASAVAIEPACGSGAFLIPMVARLVASCREHSRALVDAREAIVAVDLQQRSIEVARDGVVKLLLDEGVAEEVARDLATSWVTPGDFLLDADHTGSADFVLGNPPYVRLEEMSPDRVLAYRRRCPTMGGRADLFVGFFEVGLRALRPGGVLGFICADRWMHNQYGRALRQMIGESFSLESAIVMHDVDAFEEQVSAYPAITVLRRAIQTRPVLADTTARFGESDARSLLKWMQGTRNRARRNRAYEIAQLKDWHTGPDAWPTGSPEHLALVADLERRFPPLEESAVRTRVGIGVATGADEIYVTTDSDLVEPERLLPLSMVRDTRNGRFEWSGHYLVDPWSTEAPGELVDLERHPRLRAYLDQHVIGLKRRNVAGRRPAQWYRTIDRVDHTLTGKEKLLLPDMKMRMEPVYEPGGFYPHHNLYFVASDGWPIDVLGGLLMSDIAELFMRTYAVKMRGGTIRFQAQYLRRIRLPQCESIGELDRRALASAFETRDFEMASKVAGRLYGLDGTAARAR
ncbi:MAG: Eco57I restriction-modification methylase domain-containing protein [Actinomycetota bacterium]